MQLKGLVRFFTIALILICLYQLSFTWFVHNHESAMKEKAERTVKGLYPSAKQKYPTDKVQQVLYQDTLDQITKARLQHLLDSTKGSDVGPFGIATYQTAKDRELKLGLDLQGGMNVTLEVSLDGVLRALANDSKDINFNKALALANQRKANSGADYISLFVEAFKETNPTGKLAPLFVVGSNKKLTYNSSDGETISYIRTEAASAFNNAYKILSTRIDRFGVAQPTINPDATKGTISVELAGVTDPERVRKFLQSSANLQFFELYNINEIGSSYQSAETALAAYLKGLSGNKDSALAKRDTSSIAKINTTADTSKNSSISQLLKKDSSKNNISKNDKNASLEEERKKYPLSSLISIAQPSTNKQGQSVMPSAIGYVATKDTSLLNSYLQLDIIKNKFPANLMFMYGLNENESAKSGKSFVSLYAIKKLPTSNKAKLEGEHVIDAKQDFDEFGNVAVKMEMDAVGTRIWAKMTEDNIGRGIAIVLDGVVYSAPSVNSVIPNGSSVISGRYSVNEAQDLADILKSGKLPAPAKIVQEQLIGPTLGQEAVQGGIMSFAIAFGVIFILMLIYYNTGGWVANIALILNLLFTIGILSGLGATLTAPGIAGLVLTIGMAVDTNVIIFERIKEELTKGKGYQLAVADGYKRSYAPVLDAHVTTLLTALILFYFGLGPVLGFATTQIIGILLSLFCGIMVSRMITEWYMNKKRHLQYFTTVSKKIFKHASFKFIEYRKVAYGISFIILALGIASFFNGFDEGVEFSGGRSYTVRFKTPIQTDVVRNNLHKVFGKYPIIKTVGDNRTLNITTDYKINETGQEVDAVVEQTLYRGLQPILGKDVAYSTFKTQYKQSSQTVLPTISDDLKSGAKRATIISLLIISLYIFIRFRDWRYSVGTLVSLLHDVLVTLIVFSFLRKIVPFPLEIDQHFIAAILTVIGFSMNDTVIVFDRVREYSRKMIGASKATIINKAINDTLSRTIMTSLTVFLTLLILFIFGGEVTRGFAFAMLIGVFTGTYSSIFVAAPILVDFAKKKPLGQSKEDKKIPVSNVKKA